MNDGKLRRMVLTAMFAALCCVATVLIRVPTLSGYTNLGDAFVLLGSFILGPWYGALAGGIGSGFADLLAGYGYYIPGSVLIKGAAAWMAGSLLGVFFRKGKKPGIGALLVSALAAEAIVVAGYFGYKALILGKELAAAASIPNNLVQGAAGIAISIPLYRVLSKIPQLRQYFWKG